MPSLFFSMCFSHIFY